MKQVKSMLELKKRFQAKVKVKPTPLNYNSTLEEICEWVNSLAKNDEKEKMKTDNNEAAAMDGEKQVG